MIKNIKNIIQQELKQDLKQTFGTFNVDNLTLFNQIPATQLRRHCFQGWQTIESSKPV